MKLIKTLCKFLSVVFVVLALFLAYHIRSNAPVTVTEVIADDEVAQIERSRKNFLRVIDENKTTYHARGAHSKGHACVKAYFSVLDKLPEQYQHGIFQTPGNQYKTWIRFSNGRSSMKNNHDADKDAHGMAIKLIDVKQDFLMHDSPVFFAANLEDYNRFVESDDKILYFVSGLNPFKWKLRELSHGLATLKEPPISPLWSEYFSNTAYKLGPHNIKFSAKACSVSEETTTEKRDLSDPDFLRKTMKTELAEKDACFEFRVQLQKPDKYMPIEDPSILWKEGDSPFVTLATINIPKQEFDSSSQQQFCENLSFTPWNALPEHQPIGQMNRIRKKVYEASALFRHKNNQTSVPENLDW